MNEGALALVMGESLVDVVRRGGTSTVHPGGSPLNVAYGLARLGIPTRFVTQFGNDPRGRIIDGHLRRAGVLVEQQHHDRRTSTAQASIDADGHATYLFDIDWSIEPVRLEGARLLHVGSIGAVREPGAGTVARAADRAHRDMLVSFDPNIRPATIADPERARARIMEMIGRSHIVKLSDEDAEWLLPGAAPRDVLDRLLDRGPALVALTRGASGSMLATPHATVDIPVEPVTVADTIGAGDAFMSGLLYGVLDQNLTEDVRAATVSPAALERLGTIASAAARITVTRPAATPPDREELLHALASLR